MLLTQKKHYIIRDKISGLEFRPYLKEYVPAYNQWMQDPHLLEVTGSEPLTLEQQLENQDSWIQDPSKYTFLIFSQTAASSEKSNKEKPVFKMIGDINLFFSEWIEPHEAEINIMIAEKEYRGRGLAARTLEMIEQFGAARYGRTEIIAKIKHGNEASLRLFKKTGYTEVGFSETFQEHELRKNLKEAMNWVQFCERYEVEELKL